MLYSQFSDSFYFLDTPSNLDVEENWEQTVYTSFETEIAKNNILQQWNIQEGKDIRTALVKVYAIIFPRKASLRDQQNQQKWEALLKFLNGHSTVWVSDLLKQIALHENRLDALLCLIEHFKVTAHDLSKRKISIPDSQYINKLPEMEIKVEELPLPPELKPFQKKKPIEEKELVFNQKFFDELATFANYLDDEYTANLVYFLIDKGFLDFSILNKKLFDSKIIQKHSFVNRIRVDYYEEEKTAIDKSFFKAWLNEWKNECGIMDDIDEQGIKTFILKTGENDQEKESLHQKQHAIRRIVKYGFSPEYTKKAFALYVLDKKKDNGDIFFENGIYLEKNYIHTELLIDFINALPKDITELSLTGHTLDDAQFSAIIDTLKQFKYLKHLSLEQPLSEKNRKKLAEIFNSKTNPVLNTITYCRVIRHHDFKDDIKYLEDIKFLKEELKLFIYTPNTSPEDDNSFFDYHQSLNGNKTLNLNEWFITLFDQISVNHLLKYLNKPEIQFSLTTLSGNISDLNNKNFETLLSYLPNLKKLTHLNFSYSNDDSYEEIKSRKDQLDKTISQLSPKPEYSFELEKIVVFQPKPLLPNETIKTALVHEIDEELKKKNNHVPLTHHTTLKHDTIYLKPLGSCLSEKEIDNFKDQFFQGYDDEKINLYEDYIENFFRTVVMPVHQERKRLLSDLGSMMNPYFFSSSQEDIEIVCQKMDLLSGFLDAQGESVQAFEQKIKDSIDRNEPINVSMMDFTKQLKKYISTDDNSIDIRLPINSAYRLHHQPKSPQLNQETISLSVIHKARNSVGLIIKGVIGIFLSFFTSDKKNDDDNERKKKYAHYFFTKSEKSIWSAQEAAQEASQTLEKRLSFSS